MTPNRFPALLFVVCLANPAAWSADRFEFEPRDLKYFIAARPEKDDFVFDLRVTGPDLAKNFYIGTSAAYADEMFKLHDALMKDAIIEGKKVRVAANEELELGREHAAIEKTNIESNAARTERESTPEYSAAYETVRKLGAPDPEGLSRRIYKETKGAKLLLHFEGAVGLAKSQSAYTKSAGQFGARAVQKYHHVAEAYDFLVDNADRLNLTPLIILQTVDAFDEFMSSRPVPPLASDEQLQFQILDYQIFVAIVSQIHHFHADLANKLAAAIVRFADHGPDGDEFGYHYVYSPLAQSVIDQRARLVLDEERSRAQKAFDAAGANDFRRAKEAVEALWPRN